MRRISEKMGVPAATVSQIEKGQRALKQQKIADWAEALEVNEADLYELWLLSQGQIQTDGGLLFYTNPQAALSLENPPRDVVEALHKRPDLELIYSLADRMAKVLSRLLPGVRVWVEPNPDDDGPRFDPAYDGPLTDDQVYANEQWANALLLPFIGCISANAPDRERRFPFDHGVLVPILEELAPIVRRRGKSVTTVDLEDLIQELSGPERERVRGYVEAVIEQRANPTD